MKYDAITIDTSTFEKSGLRLNEGILETLSQFSEGSAKLILSEIVTREVLKHLIQKNKETTQRLNKTIKDASGYGLLNTDQTNQLKAIYEPLKTPEEASENLLDEFIKNTNAEIITAESADMKELVETYFSSQAPFEPSGSKKNEFPDAIALISMESWAKANEKKILAISQDKGWKSFADNSTWIDIEDDLASALVFFQKNTKEAEAKITNIIKKAVSGELLHIQWDLETLVTHEVFGLEAEVHADSSFEIEHNLVEFNLKNYSLSPEEIKIIQTGENLIVAQVGIEINAVVATDFDFYSYDSIDKEHLILGNSTVEVEETFNTSLLLTFEGDFSDDEVEITDGSLGRTPSIINFGFIEPDWMY